MRKVFNICAAVCGVTLADGNKLKRSTSYLGNTTGGQATVSCYLCVYAAY